ncbi:MAG: hypothetical protein J7518_19265 [Nocardioidaceae bacterium]|nr:hypothetical protein [Nocardioidaceae bacterium]
MGEVRPLRGGGSAPLPAGEGVASARAAYRDGRWREARDLLDRVGDLGAADLELRGTIAFLTGDARAYFEDLAAAYRSHDDPAAAARVAAWLGVMHLIRGETGHSAGWMASARRLTEEHGECAASAYLNVTPILADQSPGRDEAIALAVEMNQIARRYGDIDAIALTGQTLGQLLIRTGRAAEGRDLMDEAMVAAASGQLSSPLVEILVYLAVMEACRLLFDVTRAREWTTAIARLEARSPDLVAFAGVLSLCRAQLHHVEGDWDEALDAAARATDAPLRGEALLVRAEVLRKRGDLDAAARLYDDAAARGAEAVTGLTLLHLARGEHDLAAARIQRALAERTDARDRAALLPTAVTVLAGVDLDEAGRLATELAGHAAHLASPLLVARARQAEGEVALARGEAGVAVPALRAAIAELSALGVPDELAACRMLAARAYAATGHDALAALEEDAARALAEDLRMPLPTAAPADPEPDSPLSARELEVLRLVALGATNREIAEQLTLSPRTVDRHVSNILGKVSAPTRAAAAAYAVERGLL